MGFWLIAFCFLVRLSYEQITYCEFYADTATTTCKICTSGYGVSGDKLICLDNNKPGMKKGCLKYQADNINCYQCQCGMAVNSLGLCVTNAGGDVNCDEYSTVLPSQTACIRGKYYNDLNQYGSINTGLTQSNIGKILGCAQYDSNNLLCIVCFEGFVLKNDGTCIEGDSQYKCLTYTSSTTCATCQSKSYEPNKYGCVCARPYFYSYDTTCRKLIAFCILPYFSDFTCLQCQAGYGLSSDFKTCFQNSLKIQNCQQYSGTSNDKCSTCSNGFVPAIDGLSCVCTDSKLINVAGNKCFKTQTIPNCLKSGANDRCELCAGGYSLTFEGFACVTTIANCISHTYDEKCLACTNGFYGLNLDNTACLDNSLPGKTPGCKEYSGSPLACTSCYAGTAPSCTTITGCLAYNSDGTCSTLTNCDQVDSATGVCWLCSSGYNFHSGTQLCTSNDIANCRIYDGTSCTECKRDYALISNSASCSQLSLLENLGCKTFGSNADTLIASNCQTCNPNFVASLPYCTANVQNCMVHKSATICFQCRTSFVLIKDATKCVCAEGYGQSKDLSVCYSNSLAGKVAYCELYDVGDSLCLTCYEGYTLSSDATACFPTVQRCQLVNFQNGKCIQCQNGFVPQADGLFCHPSITNCDLIDNAVSTRCVSCSKFYAVTSNYTCALQIGNCLVPSDTVTCTTCISGYLPSSSQTSCIMNSTTNCNLALTTTKCYQCTGDNGLNYNQDSCSANNGVGKVPGCRVYGLDETTCVDCLAGYLPDNLLKIGKCFLGCSLVKDGACGGCLAGYSYTQVDKLCSSIGSTHCLQFDGSSITNGNCLICESGYVVNELKVCIVSTFLGCLNLTADGSKCSQCFSQYVLLPDGSCAVNVGACASSNCQTLITGFAWNSLEGSCKTCQSGYYLLSSGKCIYIPSAAAAVNTTSTTQAKQIFISVVLTIGVLATIL